MARTNCRYGTNAAAPWSKPIRSQGERGPHLGGVGVQVRGAVQHHRQRHEEGARRVLQVAAAQQPVARLVHHPHRVLHRLEPRHRAHRVQELGL